MKRICILLSLLLLTSCNTIDFIDVEPVSKTTFPSSFTLKEGISYPSAPDTYEEILELMRIMVEEDIMAMEVPYPVNLLELDIYSAYQYAYQHAYQHINSTHIEYTSNTPTYYTGYYINTEGAFYITFSRESPIYSLTEIQSQNDFFAEEVQRYFTELQETGVYTQEMEPMEQIKVLFDFTVEQLSYDFSLQDISFLAYGSVTVKSVVCQGYVALFNALLKLAGFDAEGVIGYSTDNGEPHIWTRVLLGDTWHYFDPTFADRPTWTADEGELLCNYTYFDMSDETMLYDRSTTRYSVNNATLELP